MRTFLACIIHYTSMKSYTNLADTHIYSYTMNTQAQIQCLLETLLQYIIETLLLSLLFLSVNVVCLTWKLCLTSMLEVIILSSIPQNFKENFRVLQFLSL